MEYYDVIVIGGGPAGMFAAGFAAREGARVLLLEKNRQCGAKLLITGKGRCNLTHDEADPRRFSAAFGRNGRALLTALYAFDVAETVAFFERLGLELQVERGGRVFPQRGDAGNVQQALLKFLRTAGVDTRTGCEVRELHREGNRITAVGTAQGDFRATCVVLATGGLSYPETGCTGDGYAWAEATGHRLVPTVPALVPVRLKESWTGAVSRLNLKNVNVSVWSKGKKVAEKFGEAFFTRHGIGGPIILDLSRSIRTALERGPVTLQLDLKPAVAPDLFDKRLQRELAAHQNQDFGNALGGLLPRDLIPVVLQLCGINPQKKCHSVTRGERQRLLELFKAMPLEVTGCEGFDKAIVTAGGVSLRSIDMRTMRSKSIDNLYFAGELIDLDGPTGGYNLQVCWSTGHLAGIQAARAARSDKEGPTAGRKPSADR